jgi:hypothetical protein
MSIPPAMRVGPKKHDFGLNEQDTSTSQIPFFGARANEANFWSLRQIKARQLSKRDRPKYLENWRRHVAKLDAHERKLIELALIERHGRLLEAVGDTTLTVKQRRAAASELLLLTSLNETVH